MRHLKTLKDFSNKELFSLIDFAIKIKKKPRKYRNKLQNKSLLMLFEKPSLRTFISFDVAMAQMGGNAIFYSAQQSPLGSGKESIADTSKVASRYVDIIMARMFAHKDFEELADNSNVPCINALTNFTHPCQIVADLMTIKEKKGALKNLKLAYLGDCNNNVTHSLLYGCSKVGISISLGCPKKKEFSPDPKVVKEAEEFAKENLSSVIVTSDPVEAIKDADIVYTDSWMSYHIPKSQQKSRLKALKKYQINEKLFRNAKSDALFMHCLPAERGMEVTGEVIDSNNSVVLDQAENRLHSEKAIILFLLEN